jgi:23S rRNA (guanosine2251-2'-O)-methyltransferase
MKQSETLVLKNPHSILAALIHRPQDVQKITLPSHPSDDWKEVETLARSHKITVAGATSFSDRDRAGSGGGKKDSRPQSSPQTAGRESGASATISQKESGELHGFFESEEDSGLWLALDSLTDPQNVGAIFRVASFFGVKGILITEERSSPMTGVVYDIACGGMEDVPFVQVVNLKQALDKAKEDGLWILGSSEHAKKSHREFTPDRKWLLIVGNEEKGMRRLTQDSCDEVCTISNKEGQVTSLNVGAATAILVAHFS